VWSGVCVSYLGGSEGTQLGGNHEEPINKSIN